MNLYSQIIVVWMTFISINSQSRVLASITSNTASPKWGSRLPSSYQSIICNPSTGQPPHLESISNRAVLRKMRMRCTLRATETELGDTFNAQLTNLPVVDTPPGYVYVPPEVGWEIYVGSAVAVMPIAWGAVEFYKRIATQRACLLCKGSGLVYATRSGTSLTRPRKCWSCGGFIPWMGWKMFWFSTFFDVGNGGVLQRPASDYDEINSRLRKEMEEGESRGNDDTLSSESYIGE